MNSDFELCFACSNYGALHCKICQNNYCYEHLCEHLEENHRLYSDLSTPILRLKRDQLFQELKSIQTELDMREPQSQTSSLNNFLASQGYDTEFYLKERNYGNSTLRKIPRSRTNSRNKSDTQHTSNPQRNSLEQALQSLQHLTEHDRRKLAERIKANALQTTNSE